ncbi:pilin [Liquorilactobacillus hordei]|uniref:pilin n=1 Tax=Liquorilactobacillus hordei TaxID=468911 RepID=UPI001CBD4CB1|nr:pilin [Liquorilactobacillus hordei]MBZ2406653.1 hypothetical protein [Liquorilactobacillus hordei]
MLMDNLLYAVMNSTVKASTALQNAQLKVSTKPFLYDAVSSATSTIDSLTSGVQLICYAMAALFFAFGAGQYITGGDESMRKAKHRWVGAGVGLIVAVAAAIIRDYIKAKSNFS